MRKGQNPAKFVKDVARPERITVALLNYIPFLSGFYAKTLDVLKVCMESMRKDAGLPFDLMVFDNGSCTEVRDFLIKEKEEGRIQYLVLAEKNMGKGGAWNTMLAGAPGEIIAYTDSDVLFSPKWLSRSVEILETFPNVGMVTARPFRTPPEFYEFDFSNGHGKMRNSKTDNSFHGKLFWSSISHSDRLKKRIKKFTPRQRIGAFNTKESLRWQAPRIGNSLPTNPPSNNSCPLTWTSLWDRSASWTSA